MNIDKGKKSSEIQEHLKRDFFCSYEVDVEGEKELHCRSGMTESNFRVSSDILLETTKESLSDTHCCLKGISTMYSKFVRPWEFDGFSA